MSIVLRLTCICICLSFVSSNFNGKKLVIEIGKDVPTAIEDCVGFLSNLEMFLKSSSQYLESSFNNRLYFSNFEIIIPPSMHCDMINDKINDNILNYDGALPDVTITNANIINREVWTQQSVGECGVKGDQIFIAYDSIAENLQPEKFVKEWLKYEYGVFDTTGSENDEIYPPCDAHKFPTCNDAHQNNSSALFSDYDRYFPSKHNFLCNHMSPMDVILRHADFEQSEGLPVKHSDMEPAFKYVRKSLTRYSIIIDDNELDINVRDSFQFLRDALRKFLEEDLDHKTTEAGIFLTGGNQSELNEDPNMMKSLSNEFDREEIFSSIPWYITKNVNVPKCSLNMAITKSINLLKHKAKRFGSANNLILVISPGLKCLENIEDIAKQAKESNIKIVTINYPGLGLNKFELDKLAALTNGLSFTINEQKQNEQQSLLTTFFELTNVLMHISATYAVNDVAPVEIYRKELVDMSSREDNRPTIDSFMVDDATTNINFFVYIYDRREKNIEKGMKLVAPNSVEFNAVRELRAEYHQLKIIGNLSGIHGSWSYHIKRFFGNPQPHIIQILGDPKPDMSDFINMKSWVHQNSATNIVTIFTQVLKGAKPIIGAYVLAHVKKPNGTHQKIQLFDNGSGGSDIMKGDGIYSRYFVANSVGVYKFEIIANDNGGTAFVRDNDNDRHETTGSEISSKNSLTVPSFQRYSIPLTVSIKSESTEVDIKQNLLKLGRIGDLKWTQINTTSSEDPKILLEWTEPDFGGEVLNINQEIRFGVHLKDIVDNFDTLTNSWSNFDMGYVPIPGILHSFSLNFSNHPDLIEQPFYLAIRIRCDEVSGPISNFIRVHVKRRSTPVFVPTENHNTNDINDNDDTQYYDDDGVLQTNPKVAAIKIEILILILVAVILISSLGCCFFCLYRKKGKGSQSKLKAQSEKSPPKKQISVVTPNTPSFNQSSGHINQYRIAPENPPYTFSPDHLIVGLPELPLEPSDMIKHDFSDNLIEELKQQRQFQQHQMMMDSSMMNNTNPSSDYCHSSMHFDNFSDYYTASQLLQEHERRQSPLEFIDSNREMAPEIPNLPIYHSYGYEPPHYTTSEYRPGSMQSMTNISEKKIRNITMV